MKKLTIIFFAIFLLLELNGQEVEPVKNVFKGTRFVNLNSTNVTSKNELQMLIQHRFGNIKDGFYEWFGLDLASMRMGFEYGLTDNFQIGIGRSTYMKTFDSFLKYRFWPQTETFPVTITATVAGSFPTLKGVIPENFNSFSEKASGNVQLHVSKSFQNFGFQFSPGYIGTGYIPTENNSFSFATLGVGGSAKLSKKVTLNIEYLHRFEDEIDFMNPLSAGIDIRTSGHLFQIIVSNTQQMSDQTIITNPVGNWKEGHLFMGFNLIRGFNLKPY